MYRANGRPTAIHRTSPYAFLSNCIKNLGSFYRGYSKSSIQNHEVKMPECSKDLVETDHLIIGGGVVGLATAYKLAMVNKSSAQLNSDTIVLVERNHRVGEETSSRNSEVIHAGIYYTPGSFKEKLCIDGRNQLYEYCASKGIKHSKIGKWIVAQNETSQIEYLQKLKKKADDLGVPTMFLSTDDALYKEPNVKAHLILESKTTGIVDSAFYLQSLEWEFSNLNNHHLVLNSTVTHVLNSSFRKGYIARIRPTEGEPYWIQTQNIINAAGLGAAHLANIINQSNGAPIGECNFQYHFCKGNYFSYSGPAPAKRLVYPVPDSNLTSLGLHLTLDLSGNAKFGPDVEFLDDAVYPTFDYSVNPERKSRFSHAASSYLHNIDPDRLNPDYAGIRPKLSRDKANDFILQANYSQTSGHAINLIGIESPGLTSSLAIGDWVVDQLY